MTTPNDDLLAALVTHQAHAKRMPAVVMERVEIEWMHGEHAEQLLGRAMSVAQHRRPKALVILPHAVEPPFKGAAGNIMFGTDIPCIIDAQELAE